MPFAAPSACPLCQNTMPCPTHSQQHRRESDRLRGNSYQRGYTRRWRVLRDWFLHQHPFCANPYGLHFNPGGAIEGGNSEAGVCLSSLVPAAEVDHVTPHRGDAALMWDEGNLQSLCHDCHSRKTATEDGGFGHERTEVESATSGDPALPKLAACCGRSAPSAAEIGSLTLTTVTTGGGKNP